MAAKKRGLGRGLDALIAGRNPEELLSEEKQGDDLLKALPVDLIQRGRYQPRIDMKTERLQELADSIKAQGVVQPIVVRPIAEGRYEIIAGERRWRAAQLAGLHEIPAVIRDVSDQAAMCLALIENIQRENLNPIEEARALERLLHEFEMTHDGVADAVGRSRASVSNLMRLLELRPEVREMVESGDLEMGHARALLGLTQARQMEAARKVVSKGLSVRATEQMVRQLHAGDQSPAKKTGGRRRDPNITGLEQDLAERLGARVEIKSGQKGRGSVVIHYSSLDELDGILQHIK
ncbi:ParB family chromosome partitioning protein [Methylohalomonas lacus]|uniref:Probable chromosome-partitioning protein ParB n=1 Tax=Methylohalomonas lacus TaxID=398773 RepID=A0AAE3HKG4_9GAMM|nr:ParB/RepB/Spo0J family partition protein [Methylohalomonas lacus]MCS3903440.1 ParB family chromosome partitioning protein [Methylohalomonas lacus]